MNTVELASASLAVFRYFHFFHIELVCLFPLLSLLLLFRNRANLSGYSRVGERLSCHFFVTFTFLRADFSNRARLSLSLVLQPEL